MPHFGETELSEAALGKYDGLSVEDRDNERREVPKSLNHLARDDLHLDEQGNYRYLGRKDRQIKTRGYRVELDEIEVALLAHSGVEEAAVYPIPDGQGSNLIEAAVTAKDGQALTADVVLAHVAGRLPGYAVPVTLDVLSAFPRTSTGKIDRRELVGGGPGTLAGGITNSYDVDNDLRNPPDIFVCRGPRWDWTELWKRVKRYS